MNISPGGGGGGFQTIPTYTYFSIIFCTYLYKFGSFEIF